jgi:hypothetical protein
MKQLTLLAIILVSGLCTSFQDEVVVKKLPEPTHTGENIFACNVNGELMVAKENSSDVIGDFGIKFSYSKANNLMYIQGSCTSPQYDVELCFGYSDTLGTYPLNMSYPFYTFFWDLTSSSAPNAINQFQPDVTHTGAITITYYDGTIIAGTFSFDGVNRKGDVVHVTDGRFDIKKQQ